MKIKDISLLCLIFLWLNFLNRSLGTFLPRIYIKIQIASMGYFVNLGASICYLIFYYLLFVEFRSQSNLRLKNASIYPIITSFLILLNQLDHLFLILLVRIHSNFAPRPFLAIILPLLSSISVIYFLKMLYNVSKSKIPVLQKAAQAGIIGHGIAVVIHLISILNLVFRRILPDFYQFGNATAIMIFPIILLSTIFIAYFYRTLYKHSQQLTYLQEL